MAKGGRIVKRNYPANKNYLTAKEVEALDLFKKYGSQKDVAKKMNSSGANVSLTLKRAREKIVKSKNTLQQAEEKGYLGVLGISYLTDVGEVLLTLLNSEKALCLLDKNHKILMVNAGIEKLFGGETDFVDKNCHDVFVGKGAPISGCPMITCFKTGKMSSAVRTCTAKSGRTNRLKITAIPIKNKRGSVVFGVEYFEPME